jgi:hypothetical protein
LRVKNLLRISCLFLLTGLTGCSWFTTGGRPYDYSQMDIVTARAHRRAERFVKSCVEDGDPVKLSSFTRIDSLLVNYDTDTIDIYFNRYLSRIPLREDNVEAIYDALDNFLGWRFAALGKRIHASQYRLDALIPNFYRSDAKKLDRSRLNRKARQPAPLVQKLSDPSSASEGLDQKYIALWHSHGWYYEQKLKRWEWQRARLFQTVEDLGPLSFAIPYLVPMLENAGATVFLPRERDVQTHEVVVDNDTPNDTAKTYREISGNWRPGNTPGFAIGSPPYDYTINPFRQGTFRIASADSQSHVAAEWIPNIPETGYYYVSISWCRSDSNITDAHYTVFHTGGKTEYLINQQIGGQTWIYLGKFKFNAGYDPEHGKVVLDNKMHGSGGFITADAVRFGGGMGDILREGQISRRPRYTEGARYYLQYAGMPDTLVYSLNNEKSDYRDDYQCRGEWVNYLRGKPFGPNRDRQNPGLGIPIDISMAFHTDAGITRDQTVIGTLSIYSTYDADSNLVFPDSMSRLANRDLADIMQSQVVSDLKIKYDKDWTRRDLWESGYSEALRPNVPAVLLELLSHQNFVDMQFGLDPQFRFDVSRAIYKSMLKFIATQDQRPFVVQPLPVSHLAAVFDGPNSAVISWQPVEDTLETTAVASEYKVYTRIDNNGFDNGVLTNETHYRIANIQPETVYSFKVAALNEGGESFPSEIMALGFPQNPRDTVLIINAFDRIAPPAIVDASNFQGFFNLEDEGEPDHFDVGFTGQQFNFDPGSKWTDDDAPGFGASFADYETSKIAGNSFDYPALHGRSLLAAGFAFVSTSDEVIEGNMIDPKNYRYIDLIMGEEKTTDQVKNRDHQRFIAFTPALKEKLEWFFKSGGRGFISGSYIGTELFSPANSDSSDILFAQNVLKIFQRTGHAVKTGKVYCTEPELIRSDEPIIFNTSFNSDIYRVEAPDALEPADSTARTVFRYNENNMSAGVAFKGVYRLVVLGFPFETVLGVKSRDALLNGIFNFLGSEE